MTKREARKLELGDRVQERGTANTYRVLGRIDEHPDPKAAVPLFRVKSENAGTNHEITYRLLIKLASKEN